MPDSKIASDKRAALDKEPQTNGKESPESYFNHETIDCYALFEAIDSPVSLLDTKLRYQYVNCAYEKYLGITKDHIIGKTPAIIIRLI